MLNNTPCVVLEGSGRLADVIAQVSALPVSKVTLVLISQLLKRFFVQEYKNFTELQVIEWTKKVMDENIHIRGVTVHIFGLVNHCMCHNCLCLQCSFKLPLRDNTVYIDIL